MDQDEQLKQQAHQKFIESLSPSDSAQLEQLGHHGIGGVLNRDEEADLNVMHEYKNSVLYKQTQSVSTRSNFSEDRNGWNANPVASVLVALVIIAPACFMLYSSTQKAVDHLPPAIRAWPSVIANVAHYRTHGNRPTYYDYTFNYKVAGQDYFLKEKDLGTPMDMSEIKYDPAIPTHCYRVPLDAEGIIPCIIGFIGLLMGCSLIWDAVAKWRAGSSGSIGVTLFFLFIAGTVALCELGLWYAFAHPANPSKPYSVATTTDM